MRGERKLVSVLFADLTGYTALAASLDPEEVYGFLRPTLASLQRIVEDFGGTVVFVAGDGFMAVFGVPIAHEDDAERAVRAALASRDHVRELNVGREGFRFPEVHAGINSGEVIVAPSEEAGGFKVVGDTVNTASRLADLAPAGRVIVDADTRARTAKVIRYGPRRLRKAKGKKHPLQSYEALGSRPVTQPDRRIGVFVDREDVRAELDHELEETISEGRSRLLIVSGDPGIGKSSLAAEFCRGLPARSVLIGRCLPFGQRLPLQALAEAVAGAADTSVDAPPEEMEVALERLARRIRTGPRARSLATDLRTLLGYAEGRAPPRASIGDAIRAVRLVMEWLAAAGPLVVVLDDLHWADPDLRAAMEDLRRTPWDGPILFLGLARPIAWLRPFPASGLAGLDQGSMRELLQAALGGEIPGQAIQTSISRADGNPLFLEESIGMLVEAGVLVRDGNVWRLTDRDRLDAVPSTIRLLIAARIDGLLPEEKHVLQDASVCGTATWDRLIRDLSDVPDHVQVLRSLVTRDLLRSGDETAFPGMREYGFKHILIRDVAYDSLPRSERARRHLAVAGWLRKEGRGRPDLLASLAHHFEQAWRLSLSRTGPGPDPGVARSAVRYLSRWADQTRRTQARAAEEVYARALGVAEGSGDAVEPLIVTRLLVGRAECLIEMGRHREAVLDAGRGRDLAEKHGDRTLLAHALLALGRSESDLGRMPSARRVLQHARSLFEAEGDLRGQGWALHRLSETWGRVDYRREIEDLREAHHLFTRARDRSGRSTAAQDLAYLLSPMGGKEFRRWYEASRRLVEDEGDLRSRAGLVRTWGVFSYYRGDHVEALRLMEEARPLAADAGDRYAEADALVIAATAAAIAGDPHQAESLSSEALALSGELESARVRASALLAAALAALRLADPGAASSRLRRAKSAVASHRIRLLVGETALMEGLLSLDRGAWDLVEKPARQLRREVRVHGWTLLEPLPALTMGRASLGAGRLEEAISLLGRAVDEAQPIDVGGTLALAETLREQAMLLAGREPLTAALPRSQEPEVQAAELQNHGLASLLTGDAVAAAAAFGEAVASWSAHGTTSWLARALAMQGAALRSARDTRGAKDALRRAERVLEGLRCPSRNRASILDPLGDLAVGR
ncbi:MAG TPA: adenylate/guanylate cyclase domain-containing protein [Actinomycetota bacterium]|nr:adenylate/guanylate cyclase domain-containing protein [Actinomycetota bacterium]